VIPGRLPCWVMAGIDPTAKLPPYRQVAQIVTDRITCGQYPGESRLPSESDFMEEFELARSTVRRAMAYLRKQGLVETVPTRGTYVS
jgi:DNA-binding GntR family transcriptional regulator